MEIEIPYNWSPRSYQLDAWKYYENGGRRAVEVWHRRAGKDLFAINLIVKAMIQRPGLYWHLLPTYRQGRKIVWNGFTKDGRKFLDHFPKDLIASKNDTEMRIILKNGAIYQVVGTDDTDSLVGTNPFGCVFSEYSLQDPGAWDLVRPILAENDGWALFIYTPRGNNHGKRLHEMAKKNPKWHHAVLKAGSGPESTKRDDDTPVISDEVIQDEREAGMSEELIDQEFYCSFDSPVVGAYYGKQMLEMLQGIPKRITNVPYEPKIPVHTAWDLGMNDSTSIIFFQQINAEVRIMDYLEDNGEGLQYYIKEMDKKNYVYGDHFAPHDINVKEFTAGGKSRLEVARALGVRFKMVQRHEIEDGIQAVRDILPRVWIDETKCERLIDALCNYKKKWNDDMKTYSNTPDHDWSSHACDAMRYLAWGFRTQKKYTKAPQDKAISDDYNIMSA